MGSYKFDKNGFITNEEDARTWIRNNTKHIQDQDIVLTFHMDDDGLYCNINEHFQTPRGSFVLKSHMRRLRVRFKLANCKFVIEFAPNLFTLYGSPSMVTDDFRLTYCTNLPTLEYHPLKVFCYRHSDDVIFIQDSIYLTSNVNNIDVLYIGRKLEMRDSLTKTRYIQNIKKYSVDIPKSIEWLRINDPDLYLDMEDELISKSVMDNINMGFSADVLNIALTALNNNHRM